MSEPEPVVSVSMLMLVADEVYVRPSTRAPVGVAEEAVEAAEVEWAASWAATSAISVWSMTKRSSAQVPAPVADRPRRAAPPTRRVRRLVRGRVWPRTCCVLMA